MILIKIIQETLNKTQQDIANDLGVSRQTISMWHSGYKLSKKNIENISLVYHIPIQLIQKTQISGLALSKDDVESVKKYLINNLDTYISNINIVKYLFRLMSKEMIFKTDNFNILINKISEKNLINFQTNVSKIDIINTSHNIYFIVIHKNNENLLKIINEYQKYLIDSNVCLLVCNDYIDAIDILTFREEI